MTNNGTTLQKDNFEKHIATFLEAYIDPRVEAYTRKVGVHEVLEISRFLRLLDAQTIQCTLKLDDIVASFIFKTSKTNVEYIRVIKGRQADSTISLEVDLKWLSEPDNSHILQRVASAFSGNLSVKKMLNTLRLFVALGADTVLWSLQKLPSKNKKY